ncbi:MAG: glutamate--tRNA ligase [Bdellovibrionales bacterium]
MPTPVRVRFAPSPTGYLHVGGARTALYNYLHAKHAGGQFIVRVEDTDEARSTEESLRMQIGDLKWLGLKWDEGPNPETLADMGPHGPYRQSQRTKIYQEYAEKILKAGKAYYCFLTDAEIEAQRSASQAAGRPPQVDSPYRNWTLAQAQERIAKGEKPVIRFKVTGEKRDYLLKDLVRGEVRFPSDMVGDFVLIRSSGMPVYNFCCVIDDYLMKISHVLRAEEHLSNTLRQMMIYEALGWQIPEFGHMSIILGSDKQKLSKRHGATSCNEYRLNGYLPEALLNFIALLGWSSPKAQEVMTMPEMIEQFTTDRLNPAAAVFDEQKLAWMNATHLRALPHDELWRRVEPFLTEAGLKLPLDQAWREQALSVFKTSMTTLKDAVELFRPLSRDPVILSQEGKETMMWETSKAVIKRWSELISAHSRPFLTEVEFNDLQEKIKNDCQVKGKHLFMPIRVAVIGKPHGAELKILVPLLHKDILLERAQTMMVGG